MSSEKSASRIVAPEPHEGEGPRVSIAVNRCPFCHDAVAKKASWLACRECLARHHVDCWQESRKCASCGSPEHLVAPGSTGPEKPLDGWDRDLILQGVQHTRAIAVWSGIEGALALFCGLAFLGSNVRALSALVMTVAGFAVLASAFGLWFLRSWGRWAPLALNVLLLALPLFTGAWVAALLWLSWTAALAGTLVHGSASAVFAPRNASFARSEAHEAPSWVRSPYGWLPVVVGLVFAGLIVLAIDAAPFPVF